MKTILFLDDWMLDYRQDVARKFIPPERSKEKLIFDPSDSAPPLLGYCNVIRDPKTSTYKLWYAVNGKQEIAGRNFNTFLCYAESRDGINWTRPDLGFAEKYGFDRSLKNCAGFDHYPTVTYKVSLDPFDPDPNRRYKLVATDVAGPILDNKIKGTLYVSGDGIDWKLVKDACWYVNRMGSDTDNNILFNPITQRYQIICRPSCLDRRIALVESDDLVHWSEPLVILHPDPLDEPLLQLYSMPHFYYHDHFLGLMQVQHISSSEPSAAKWFGKVDTELTYSYNGVHWNRTDRGPFIPRPPLGQPGCEQLYAGSMAEEEDGTLRFYSLGQDVEHYANQPPEPVKTSSEVLIHTLRADGFAALEPKGGYGLFSTRTLIPRQGELRVNLKAPNGFVRVQASDTGHKPYPGYTLDDCLPMTGDNVAAVPRWKNDKTLDTLVGQWVRLEFKLYQAQIYAIHWDFQIQYGDAPIERI